MASTVIKPTQELFALVRSLKIPMFSIPITNTRDVMTLEEAKENLKREQPRREK